MYTEYTHKVSIRNTPLKVDKYESVYDKVHDYYDKSISLLLIYVITCFLVVWSTKQENAINVLELYS